jgi:enoyl-CoA hydratase
MTYETIIFEKEEHIAIITFNRPEAMNALNNQTRAEFARAIQDVADDDAIKVLILTGSGKAFVAGSDIKEFNKTTPSAPITSSAWVKWWRSWKSP